MVIAGVCSEAQARLTLVKNVVHSVVCLIAGEPKSQNDPSELTVQR